MFYISALIISCLLIFISSELVPFFISNSYCHRVIEVMPRICIYLTKSQFTVERDSNNLATLCTGKLIASRQNKSVDEGSQTHLKLNSQCGNINHSSLPDLLLQT